MSKLQLTYSFPSSQTNLTLTLSGPATAENILTYEVEWGDNIIDTSLSHTYATTGTYTIQVSITSSDLITNFNGSNQQAYLTSCSSFGEIGLTDLSNAFNGATIATIFPTLLPTTSIVTNMSSMFKNAKGVFATPIFGWTTTNVTNMSSMFEGASKFNRVINVWNTSNVVDMSSMFKDAVLFQASVSSWNVSNVINMTSMFQGASRFNGVLINWKPTSVTNMSSMFQNASAFNKDIGNWDVSNVTTMTNMLNYSGISIPNFDAILNGWASRSVQTNVTLGAENLLYDNDGLPGYHILTNPPNNWVITANYTCFKEGTKILTIDGYQLIETLKVGDLVLTYQNNYKPIQIIGNSKISHPASKNRIKNQLYVYKKEKFPELIEDLVMTGGHSILVDEFKNEEELTKNYNLFYELPMIDNKYRLLACIDENTSVFDETGIYNIYHLSLQSDDENKAYGIYANGLLVESCPPIYLRKDSGMNLIHM